MNRLLLLAGLVLVIYIMNEKKVFKSLSSKSNSLFGKNNTLLIVLFCGFILFMCMRKNVEGLTQPTDGECPTEFPNKHTVKVVSPDPFNEIEVCINNDTQGVLILNGADNSESTGDEPTGDKPGVNEPTGDKPGANELMDDEPTDDEPKGGESPPAEKEPASGSKPPSGEINSSPMALKRQ